MRQEERRLIKYNEVMEFIEMEHTPKNVLLVGRKTDKVPDRLMISKTISDLKRQYGIQNHYLETIL